MMWFLCPGVTPPALSLWDVDGDSVEDVFLGVTEWTNDTRPALGNKGTQGISCWRHFFVNLVCVCSLIGLFSPPSSLQRGGPVRGQRAGAVEESHAGVGDVHPVWSAVQRPAVPRGPPHWEVRPHGGQRHHRSGDDPRQRTYISQSNRRVCTFIVRLFRRAVHMRERKGSFEQRFLSASRLPKQTREVMQ